MPMRQVCLRKLNKKNKYKNKQINEHKYKGKITALAYFGLVLFQNTLCLSAEETHAQKLIRTHRSKSKSILQDPGGFQQKKNENKKPTGLCNGP